MIVTNCWVMQVKTDFYKHHNMSVKIPSVGEDVEKLLLSFTVGETIKEYNHPKEHFGNIK